MLIREEIFITTKINTTSWTPSQGEWAAIYKNKDIVKHFEQSLKDLQTDYVDLLLIHWPKFETNLGRHARHLIQDLKDAKKSQKRSVLQTLTLAIL